MLWKEAERVRQEKADLIWRNELADASIARRAAHSFMAGSEEVTQGGRHRARMPRVPEADRVHLTRNLESSFMTEDTDGIPVPKTPASALMAVETYLRLTQPPEGNAHARLHRQQIQSLREIEEALAKSAPAERVHENRGRHSNHSGAAPHRHNSKILGRHSNHSGARAIQIGRASCRERV